MFFGQFVDHDITRETTAGLDGDNDPHDMQNVRTPTLDALLRLQLHRHHGVAEPAGGGRELDRP